MTRSKLFENWTYGLKLPIPFDGAKRSYKDIGSRYNSAEEIQSTLHAPTLNALLAYIHLKENQGSGAIGENEQYFLAEYEDTVAALHKNKGVFMAAQFLPSTIAPQPYTLGVKNGHSGAALLFTLMPLLEKDEEFSQALERFMTAHQADDLEALSNEAALLCDNVYRRIVGADSLRKAGISLVLPRTGNITQLTALMLESTAYAPTTTFLGNFQRFTPLQLKEVKTTIANTNLAGAFRLSDKIFSAEEQQLIPVLDTWYEVPEEVLAIGKHIQQSSHFNRPIRNIMLRGDAGVGKTAAARAIAAALQVPYYVLTCHPHMEIYDLVGQLLPAEIAQQATSADNKMIDTVSSNLVEAEEQNQETCIDTAANETQATMLPAFEDILMDPATVLCQLTGEDYDENTTAEKAFNALIQAQSHRLAEKTAQNSTKTDTPKNDKAQFCFVKSPLIKALESGALVEIQEITLINDPGVLAGLNNLLEGQTFSLPTGEIISRDPNSVVIMTTNVGYAGCKNVNQSIISRMQMIIDMAEPTEADIVQRVMQASGCTEDERETVQLMTSVFLDIKKHCHEKIIQDGSVGMRELIDWVQSYKITKDAYQSALYTIIPSASMEEESREELIDTCLAPKIYF